MIIVAGWIRVNPDDRAPYLDEAREVISLARATAGCLDFHLTPDPLETDRINVFEQWEALAALETFRGSGPSDEQANRITGARVVQYDVGDARVL